MVKPGNPVQHLAKAATSLRAARLLLGAGLPAEATSKAYYAAFHAAQALLATANLAAETHSGVATQLARHFVKDGILPSGAARAFSHLMTDRLLADYGVDRQIDAGGGEQAVAEAATLIGDILAALMTREPGAGPAAEALRRELDTLPPPPA